MSNRHPLDFLDGARINLPKLRDSPIYAALRSHEVILSNINLNLARALLQYANCHPQEFPVSVRTQMMKAISVMEHAERDGYPGCYRIRYKPFCCYGGRIYGDKKAVALPGMSQRMAKETPGCYVYFQGMVAFPRFFKDALFHFGRYVDLDMSACHPTFLYILGERCRQAGMPVTTDGLRRYVEDNAGFVQEFIEHHSHPKWPALVRDDVKNLVTARMFGGGFQSWTLRLAEEIDAVGMPKEAKLIRHPENWAPCYRALDADLTSIANALCDLNSEYSDHLEEVRRMKEERRVQHGGKRDGRSNPRARVLSFLLQTIETCVTYTFAEILKEHGAINSNYDWGFDGLTVLGREGLREWLEEHIDELNMELRRRTGMYDPTSGIGPTFVIKPFKICPAAETVLRAFQNAPPPPRSFLLDEDPEVALQRAGGNEYVNLPDYFENILYCENMGLEEEAAEKYAYQEAKKMFERHVCYDDTSNVVRRINRKPDVLLTRKHGSETEPVSALGEEWDVGDPMKLRTFVDNYSNMRVRYQYTVPAKTQTIRGAQMVAPAEIKIGTFEIAKRWKDDPKRQIVYGKGCFAPWTHAQKQQRGVRNYSPMMDLSNDWRPFRYDYTAWYRANPTKETLSGCMLIFTLWYLLMGEECGGWLWMTKYLAHGIQFPNVSAGAMLIFRSLPGCGKGTFETGFTNMIGDHASTCTDKPDHLLGRFNGLGELSTFFFLEEASNAFTLEQEGSLKSFVTDCKQVVERKNQNAKMTHRFLRLFRFMNTALATMRMFTEEDRRTVLAECSTRFLGVNSRHHKAFYDAVDRLSVREDVLITMMWLLQRIDLTGWAPHELYRSAYHYQLLRENVHPIVTFMDLFVTWAESKFDENVCTDYILVSEYKGGQGDSLKLNAEKGICCVKPMVFFEAWTRFCSQKNIKDFEPSTYMRMGPRLLEEFHGCTKLNASRFTEINMGKIKAAIDVKLNGKEGTKTVPTSIGPIPIRLTPEERARMDPAVLIQIETLHEFINGLGEVLNQYGHGARDPPLEHLFEYCGMDVTVPEPDVGGKRSARAMDEDDGSNSDTDNEYM